MENEGSSGTSGNQSTQAVTRKLGEWLQQILGTSEISVQKGVVLGTPKILCRTLKLPGLRLRSELEGRASSKKGECKV